MQKIKQNRKGNISMIVPAILIFIIGAAILFFGVIITEDLRDSTATYLVTVGNETGAFINSSGYRLGQVSSSGFNSPTLLVLTNSSSGAIINAANYTLNTSSNRIINLTASVYNQVNVSYTYLRGDGSYIAANKSLVGLASFADFWSIIVLAVVIAVVIGLLLLVLSNKKVK